jgi:hypothetical protein
MSKLLWIPGDNARNCTGRLLNVFELGREELNLSHRPLAVSPVAKRSI